MAMSWATSYVPATLDIDHPEWLALFSPFLLKTKIETWRPSNQRSMWWNPYQMLELTWIPQYPLPPLLSKAVFTKDRNICKVEALEGGFCLHVLFFFFAKWMLLLGSDFKSKSERKVGEESSGGMKNCPLQLRRREVWAGLMQAEGRLRHGVGWRSGWLPDKISWGVLSLLCTPLQPANHLPHDGKSTTPIILLWLPVSGQCYSCE